MLPRRAFGKIGVASLAGLVVAEGLSSTAWAEPTSTDLPIAQIRARSVVLVHGLYADGSSWIDEPADDAGRGRRRDPGLERFLAQRMGAHTIELESSHLSLITHPRQVAGVILAAAGIAVAG